MGKNRGQFLLGPACCRNKASLLTKSVSHRRSSSVLLSISACPVDGYEDRGNAGPRPFRDGWLWEDCFGGLGLGRGWEEILKELSLLSLLAPLSFLALRNEDDVKLKALLGSGGVCGWKLSSLLACDFEPELLAWPAACCWACRGTSCRPWGELAIEGGGVPNVPLACCCKIVSTTCSGGCDGVVKGLSASSSANGFAAGKLALPPGIGLFPHAPELSILFAFTSPRTKFWISWLFFVVKSV